MKRESELSIAQEYETREILTPSHRFSYSPDLVSVSLTTGIGIFIIFVGIVAAIELKMSMVSSIIVLIFFIFLSIIIAAGWPFLLSLWYKEVSQKVIISPKGINYSNFLTKIECFWADFLIIEVVIHYESSDRQDLSSSWPEYNFTTLKGLFSLKGKDLWDPIILRRIFEAIVSHNPNTIIIEKENEELVLGC